MATGRPLRSWIASRFILAGVLPLLLVAALVLGFLLPQMLRDIETHHQALARAIAGQIEAHLRGAGRDLTGLADYVRQRGAEPLAYWTDPLDAHCGTGEVFVAIYIAGADDTVLAVGLPHGQRGQRDDLLGIDLSKWAVLGEARARGRPVWSEVFLSAVSARLVVSTAIPVGDRLVVGEVAVDNLADFVSRLPTGSGISTLILDGRGQIIAGPQGQGDLNLAHLPIVGEAIRGRFATQDLDLDGKTAIGTLVSVPELGWMVLVVQSRTEALRPLVSTLWALAAGALVALVLGALATLLLARGFAHRLGQYAAQAHAIAKGDYAGSRALSGIRELDDLATDLDWMSLAIRQREQDLAASQARYRSVINNTPVMIFQFDASGVLTLSDGQGLARTGLDPSSALGRSLFDLFQDYPEVQDHAQRAIGGAEQQFTWRIGETFFDTRFIPTHAGDSTLRVFGLALDITERRVAELRIESALREKEVLLKEIYHRVKNNLQVVASLLNMQAQGAGEAQVRAQFEESAARVLSMALVHEQLYRAADLASIDFAAYLEQLVDQIRGQYAGRGTAGIQIEARLAPCSLGVETAIPCGLILNELLSNAFKHGFPGGGTGRIQVQLRATGGGIELAVADDGAGLPEGFRPEQTRSLGWRLILGLTDQVGGRIRVASHRPARIELEVPPPHREARRYREALAVS